MRTKMSEVILALTSCRVSITEVYQIGPDTVPGPNGWGCEAGGASKYVASIATDGNGKVTVTAQTLGAGNGIVTLVPLINGTTPLTSTDLAAGPQAVFGWRCGDSTTDGTTVISKYLPGSCRGK